VYTVFHEEAITVGGVLVKEFVNTAVEEIVALIVKGFHNLNKSLEESVAQSRNRNQTRYMCQH
jgi:hypothetical protein